MSTVEAWITDTEYIINDTGTVTATVLSSTIDYSAIPINLNGGTVTVETKSVQIQAYSGMMDKSKKGLLADASHFFLFPLTSSIAVAHRITLSGSSDYYEVLRVDRPEEHTEVYTKKVENRDT